VAGKRFIILQKEMSKVKKRMSDEIARIAEIFGIDRNRLIAESISNFVDSEMLKCEKRIGKLWLENDMLNKKYVRKK